MKGAGSRAEPSRPGTCLDAAPFQYVCFRYRQELALLIADEAHHLLKGEAQPYVGGKGIWLKYKSLETDIVCGAVIGPMDRPTEIVAGLRVCGELRIVGRSSVLRAADRRALARWLRPPASPHPWPEVVKGSTIDRFNRDASPVR